MWYKLGLSPSAIGLYSAVQHVVLSCKYFTINLAVRSTTYCHFSTYGPKARPQ